MNIDNKDYLAAFLLSGFVGGERKILNNIPFASAISGVLLLSVANLLPTVEEEDEGS